MPKIFSDWLIKPATKFYKRTVLKDPFLVSVNGGSVIGATRHYVRIIRWMKTVLFWTLVATTVISRRR